MKCSILKVTYRDVVDGKLVMTQRGLIEEMDRSFDYEYWQRQGSTARFAAAWNLVLHYHLNVLGQDEGQLRLQRTVGKFQQQPG
jgi:hypothetical protein